MCDGGVTAGAVLALFEGVGSYSADAATRVGRQPAQHATQLGRCSWCEVLRCQCAVNSIYDGVTRRCLGLCCDLLALCCSSEPQMRSQEMPVLPGGNPYWGQVGPLLLLLLLSKT